MLLDTSGLLCYFDERDARHTDAVALFAAAPVLVTHSYVLAEFVPLCQSRRLPRPRFLEFATRLMNEAAIEVIWVDRAQHATALALLQARQDKTYSTCEAVSFLLMRQRGITEALTTDRHFEQEGFVRLLKP